MKTLKKFLFIAACIGLFTTCSKPDGIVGDDLSVDNLKKAKTNPITVTVPFKADFIGNYRYVGPSSKCEATMVQVIVDFKGTGTHLGRFNGTFEFCAGSQGYGPSESYMEAANGDILYVSCVGKVLGGRLEDHPDYVTSYWRDPFVILGGTGRFKGATGGGMTDDYNSSEDPYSHHHWIGTITLVK